MTFPNSGTLDYIPDGAVFWVKVGQRDYPVVFPDATTTKKGVVEKATTPEAESGVSDKFPDAAGVVAAISTNKSGDSDKLDGQHGSYYRNASNLNTGTVSNARLPEATTTSKGVSRQATTAQAQAGTDDEAYMTASTTSDVTLGSRKQSIKDCTTSRQAGVIYTNTDTAPRFVTIADSKEGLDDDRYQIRKDSSSAWVIVGRNSASAGLNVGFIVPPGFQYRANNFGNFNHWSELSL